MRPGIGANLPYLVLVLLGQTCRIVMDHFGCIDDVFRVGALELGVIAICRCLQRGAAVPFALLFVALLVLPILHILILLVLIPQIHGGSGDVGRGAPRVHYDRAQPALRFPGDRQFFGQTVGTVGGRPP